MPKLPWGRSALSIPSANSAPGAASPDASLRLPVTDRGLTYVFGRTGPGVGELIEVAPGVHWARLPMPGPLSHINVWALDDSDEAGEGFAIVDTGMNVAGMRAAWEALFAGPLAGKRVTRVFVTHFHPDHAGLAGWLTERFGVRLWMTRTEWLMLRMLTLDARSVPPAEVVRGWRLAGWDEARIASAEAEGWGRIAKVVSAPPAGFVRMEDGDRLAIGDRVWRVVVGSGHTPEHACLVDEAGGLMIAGDQVLPRISSNVSLSTIEPEGDPLGDWLSSIDRLLAALPAGLLVLPAHGEPFTGVHVRLAALRDGHESGLAALHALLAAAPRRVVDTFPALFARGVGDEVFGLATGEALAHLRRLEREGRAVCEVRDGVAWYEAA